MKKTIALGIVFLLFVMSFASISGIQIKNQITKPSYRGNTLYVGGSGEGNYSSIQDAIDNASDGDIVFVYDDSSPYYENIVIDIFIKLLGENSNTTLIDGNKNDDVLYISADYVYLSGFTLTNCGNNNYDCGIEIDSDYNTITNNIIHNNEGDRLVSGGILINSSYNNTILFNKIYSNDYDGISIINSDYNHIHHNKIFDNKRLGITLTNSSNNIIEDNEVYENYCGICLYPYSIHNIVKNNNIYNHTCCGIALKQFSNYNLIQSNLVINNLAHGIMLGPGPTSSNIVKLNTISGCISFPWYPNAAIVLENAYFNIIEKNNIINNFKDVIFNSSFVNSWINNYWEDYLGFGPKIIVGWIYLPLKREIIIPWFNIDWYPAKEPYNMTTTKGCGLE
jgi:parallel beta-helix repeat protein